MKLSKTEVSLILGLLLLSLVPCLGGALRVVQLSGAVDAGFLPANPRIQANPFPAILHIIGAVPFCIIGIFQFLPSFRKHNPKWHRATGRILVLAGSVTAISGLWMTFAYNFPAGLQGELLYTVRFVVSLAMLTSIALGLYAIRKRDFSEHRAWMIRAYALAQGAGTQVVLLLPWSLLLGEPSGFIRDVLMTLAWLINAMIAERIIQPRAKTAPAPSPRLA